MERLAVATPAESPAHVAERAPDSPVPPPVARPWPLIALGAAALPLYGWAAWLGDLMAHPLAFAASFVGLCLLYAAACWYATRRLRARAWGRRALPVLLPILSFALLYRLIFVPATPSLSDDFFRYVWDGYIQGQGFNPHRYPPNAPELVPLRDDEYWPRINRKPQTSAYPPFAELTFRALSIVRPFNSLVFKLAFLALELLTIALLLALLRLRGQPPALAIIYAWHPLLPFEFVASAHIDVLAVALLALALYLQARDRPTLAGIALGLATLTKLYPGLLLPAFCRRGQWRLPLATVATVIAGFIPALVTGDSNFRQLPTYLDEEGYDSGHRFVPLSFLRLALPVPNAAYIVLAGLALVSLSLWLWTRPAPLDVPRRALLLATAIMLLTTPSYPWYFAWLLPLVTLVPVGSVLYLIGAAALIYPLWYWTTGRLPLLPYYVGQYLPVYLALARGWWRGHGAFPHLPTGRARED
jgi:alpha-1,6-mannosyltransferase